MLAWLKDDVTREIDKRGAAGLILDLSGVDIVDSYVTRGIHDLAGIGRWMGVKTVVCGIRPAVAITLVDMGMRLEGIVTVTSLERAVAVLARAAAEGGQGADEPSPPEAAVEGSTT
jgi:rsbT antagonist protein RsbS